MPTDYAKLDIIRRLQAQIARTGRRYLIDPEALDLSSLCEFERLLRIWSTTNSGRWSGRGCFPGGRLTLRVLVAYLEQEAKGRLRRFLRQCPSPRHRLQAHACPNHPADSYSQPGPSAINAPDQPRLR